MIGDIISFVFIALVLLLQTLLEGVLAYLSWIAFGVAVVGAVASCVERALTSVPPSQVIDLK